MQICTTKDYVSTTLINDLQIYANEATLVQEYKKTYNYNISALQTSNNFLLIGLFDGNVIILNYSNKKEFKIYKFDHKVSCIFHIGDFYYFGSDEGKIVIFHIKENNYQNLVSDNESSMVFYADSMSSDLFRDNDNVQCYSYNLVKEYLHNAPIISIVNDGEKTYILDIRGKITIYGENTGFDISATCMIYKNYLFACEKNILYCKTKEAFACRLRVDKDILNFSFSEKGTVVFIRTANAILLYDNNTLELIKKISFHSGTFTYDEFRNRLIIYDGESFSFVEDIVNNVDYLNEEMKRIVFKETKISEKKQKNAIENNYERNYNQKNDEPQFFTKEYNEKKIKPIKKDKKKIKVYSKTESEKQSDSISEIYNDSFEQQAFSNEEYNEESSCVVYKAKKDPCFDTLEKSFISGSFKDEFNDVELLCYNKTGYVMKHAEIIEVIFHNSLTPKKDFSEKFDLASVTENGVLFATKNKLNYFGKTEWKKEFDNILLISATSKIIACVTDKIITLIKSSGIEIFSCLVQNPMSICSENEKVVLFCKNEIIIFYDYFKCKKICLFKNITFCDIESNVIYFACEKKLYCVYNDIFIELINIQDNPLCINNKHLLTCNGKIFPSPHIEYNKIQNKKIILDNYLNEDQQEDHIKTLLTEAIHKADHYLAKDLFEMLTKEKNRKLYRHLFDDDDYDFCDNTMPKHFREDGNNFLSSELDKENNECNNSIINTSELDTPTKK
ncbi:hypothetical protein COBT_001239, partial [Conglomerata obtusa]